MNVKQLVLRISQNPTTWGSVGDDESIGGPQKRAVVNATSGLVQSMRRKFEAPPKDALIPRGDDGCVSARKQLSHPKKEIGIASKETVRSISEPLEVVAPAKTTMAVPDGQASPARRESMRRSASSSSCVSFCSSSSSSVRDLGRPRKDDLYPGASTPRSPSRDTFLVLQEVSARLTVHSQKSRTPTVRKQISANNKEARRTLRQLTPRTMKRVRGCAACIKL